MVTKKATMFLVVALLVGFLVGYVFKNFLFLGTTKEGVGEQVC
jgi:hypothetical protein